MAFKDEEVIRAQHEILTQQRAHQLARYHAAKLVEDGSETIDAANRIMEADDALARLDRAVQTYVVGQQQQAGQQQRSRFGLTPAEQEIARLGPDMHKDYRDADGAPRYLSDDLKEEIYVRQRDKLRAMKASGAYSDQKG
jgi:hypothetical protein